MTFVTLTPKQLRTLVALRDAEVKTLPGYYHSKGWMPVEWVMERRSPNTLIKLEDLGLIETHGRLDLDKKETPRAEQRAQWRRRGTGARTTAKGREFVAAMERGD